MFEFTLNYDRFQFLSNYKWFYKISNIEIYQSKQLSASSNIKLFNFNYLQITHMLLWHTYVRKPNIYNKLI